MGEVLEQKLLWHQQMFEMLGPEQVSNYTICAVPSETATE